MPQSASGGVAARRALRSLELRCPPLPETVSDALALMEHPERLDTSAVLDAVERDPIVLARLLHTANSAYYGLRQTVSSLDRAVGMLGPVAVTGIVLGMQMVELPSVLDGPASACFRRLIRHSAATGFVAGHLVDSAKTEISPTAPTLRGSAAYTAGMLHDLGKLLLVYNFPDKASHLYKAGERSEADERKLERECFGCDHTEIGEFAARKMSFPEELVAVIADHRRAATSGADSPLFRATRAAHLAARAMGFAATTELPITVIAKDPVWQQIIASDLPQYGSADVLIEKVLALRPALDEFVEGVMNPA